MMTMTKSVIPEPPAPERNLPIIAIHKELEHPLGKGQCTHTSSTSFASTHDIAHPIENSKYAPCIGYL